MTNESASLTDEEATLAASQEDQDRLIKENKSLRNRTVFLRAMMNRQVNEIAALKAKIDEMTKPENEEKSHGDV